MKMTEPIIGDVLDESVEFSMQELCRICGVHEQLVVEIVEEGVVEPLGSDPERWRFSGLAVMRIQRVIRLQREFEVNLPGAALALELLEEIERLKRGGGM
jgi:chaperone modulatory protein CbpM